jgi:hypothetical protein
MDNVTKKYLKKVGKTNTRDLETYEIVELVALSTLEEAKQILAECKMTVKSTGSNVHSINTHLHKLDAAIKDVQKDVDAGDINFKSEYWKRLFKTRDTVCYLLFTNKKRV